MGNLSEWLMFDKELKSGFVCPAWYPSAGARTHHIHLSPQAHYKIESSPVSLSQAPSQQLKT